MGTVVDKLNKLLGTKADIKAAITEKGQTVAEADTFASYADKIRAISSGTDTSDATAAAGDILSGKTAYAGGRKITGTIPDQGAAIITPSVSAKTAVAAGRYTTGAVTVVGDANLRPWNIRQNVSIFDVVGTSPLPPALNEPYETAAWISAGILGIEVTPETSFIITKNYRLSVDGSYWWRYNFFAIRSLDGRWYGIYDTATKESSDPDITFGPLNWDITSSSEQNITLELAIDPYGKCKDGTVDCKCYV